MLPVVDPFWGLEIMQNIMQSRNLGIGIVKEDRPVRRRK